MPPKAIDGLLDRLADLERDRLALYDNDEDKSVFREDAEAIRTAITLLQAQIPVKPLRIGGAMLCGVCNNGLMPGFTYCPNCGRMVMKE